MKRGIGMLEDAQQTLIKNQRRVWHAVSEYILGKVYSQIAAGPKPAFSIMAKNIAFLIRMSLLQLKRRKNTLTRRLTFLEKLERMVSLEKLIWIWGLSINQGTETTRHGNV